jgi:hypothetical protein
MDGFDFVAQNKVRAVSFPSMPAPEDISLQLALNPSIARDGFRVRHEGYRSYGYVNPQENGLFIDKYDGRANVKMVVIYKNNVPAATVRLCLFDATGQMPEADRVPAMEIFETEIREMLSGFATPGAPQRAVEVSRMARSPDFANDTSVVQALFRAVGYLVLYYQADVVLNACRPHHVPMYRRFGFQKIQEPRQYPNLTYKAALTACFRSHFGSARAELPFLRGISTEDAVYGSLISGERTALYAPQPSTALPLAAVDTLAAA